MGLVLSANCAGCGYSRAELRLGATHEQIGQHDVCTREIFAAPCCRTVVSVLVYMGQRLPEAACDGCSAPLDLGPEHRYRIATLKGEVWDGHGCPACSEPQLSFTRTGAFT